MKLKFLSQCFMLAIALLYSCKKNEKEKFSDHKKAISEKIESWLSTNPGFSNNQTVMVEGNEIKLAQTIEWERSAYFAETQTNIIPVRIESANGKLPIFKYIVTILDDAGNIIECNYYNLFTKNMASESSEQTIITPDLFSFKKIPKNFTGAIIKYDLQNKMLLSRHYDSGIATNETDNVLTIKNTNRPLDENIAPPDPNCYFITIDWYWQTWVNGVLVYEQYIGSSTYLFCEGGGGGGNNGGNSGPCNFTLAQAQAELNAITYERNLISSCSPPIYPPQFTSYPITSPRSCSTGVVTLHFFAGITASYTAFFTGAIQKDGANIPWKWNTFQYNTTNLTDGTIPICFGVDKNVTANCVISGDRLYANAHVSFNFIAKVLCLSGWTPAPPYTGSFNQSFEAN